MFKVTIDGDDGSFMDAAVEALEAEMTQRTRAYRCPSHGRSPRATVIMNRDTDEFEFTGICCADAVEALVREMSDEAEGDEPEIDTDG